MRYHLEDQYEPGQLATEYPFAWLPTKVQSDKGEVWVWLETFKKNMRYVGHGKWYECSRWVYNEFGH